MAYGTNAPFGLRALYSLNGGTWVEKLTAYEIPSGYNKSIFTGDLVTFNTVLGAASVNAPNVVTKIGLYLPIYTQNNAGNANTFANAIPIVGVFQGCEYVDAITKVPTFSKYYPANTQVVTGTPIIAYVNDDPNVVWDVQISTPINATANGAFAVSGADTAAPIFPGVNSDATPRPTKTSGIGSNFSIMGGGGVNFSTIQIDATRPQLGFYTNNPVSTMVAVANGNPVTDFGTNPYGGNVLSGISGAYLCVSTYGVNATDTFTGAGTYNVLNDYDHAVATLPLKVIGYSSNSQNIPLPGKTLATTPFVNLAVMINNHVFKAGTAGPTFTAA